MTDEATITEDQVRKEHEKAMSVPGHWAYLFGVMGGGIVLMLVVMAVLGGG